MLFHLYQDGAREAEEYLILPVSRWSDKSEREISYCLICISMEPEKLRNILSYLYLDGATRAEGNLILSHLYLDGGRKAEKIVTCLKCVSFEREKLS